MDPNTTLKQREILVGGWCVELNELQPSAGRLGG